MRITRSIQLVGLLLCTTFVGRADVLEFFGLEHLPFGSATISSNEYAPGFRVNDLEFTGSRGVSTRLGEADSGAFFFPTVDYVNWGYFMRANVFGHVGNQSDAPIGLISGYRTDYATFFAQADFSAIGATSLTYQAWDGNLLLGEITVNSGDVRIYAESSQDVRVNPWWRQANGEYGASIEFQNAPNVELPDCINTPGCGSVRASRIFIRPNGATSIVHSVSRTDVIGGGGLSGFGINDVRVGLFGQAHAALGSVKFAPTNSFLRVDIHDSSSEGAGVLVELDHAATAEVRLLPVDPAPPNTNTLQERIDISLSGTFSGELVSFVGAAALVNSNGTLRLSAYLDEIGPLLLTVFSNDVPVGTPGMDVPEPLRISGGPRLVAVAANADTLASWPGYSFTFENPVTVHSVLGDLVGNRVRLAATNWSTLADLSALAITVQAIPTLTITGESSTRETPVLSISRSNNVVSLRWPDPATAFVVEARTEPTGGWFQVGPGTLTGDGYMTVAYTLTESTADVLFFRLSRYIFRD